MQIKRTKENGITVLSVIGQLVSPTSPSFEAAINSVLDEENQLILDFAQVDFLASSGIRVLLTTHKKIRASMGSLILRNVNDVVMNVLETTGLKDFLDIR